ncbi:oligopeptidase B [Salmonella enterica subsp. enterica serovar Choleraesuis]|nr:oligopeptidase B [Salmonella enterica subsp. enterica serovar Choleraesuis]
MPPVAPKKPQALTSHNDTRQDPWYWLRDDERSNPEVLDYLRQENDWAERAMAANAGLRNTVLQELIGRIPPQDDSVPYISNGWRYRQRYAEGKEYPIYQRQALEADENDWQVLLDGNEQAEGHEWYATGRLAVSPDNQLLAVAEDFVSRRQYQLRVRDLQTGHWLDELLENVEPDVEWAADSRGFWYLRKNPQTLQPWQVWFHQLGQPVSCDRLVWQEDDCLFYIGLYKTSSRRYVGIALNSSTTSETRLLDAENPELEARCLIPRRKDHEYDVDHLGEAFIVRSNREGKTFGLYQAIEPDDETTWLTLVAVRDAVMLEDFTLFNRWLVLAERERGVTRLRYIERTSGQEKRVEFSDPAYVTWVGVNRQPESDWLRYGYSSLTTPTTVYELNMASGERRMLKQTPVAGFEDGAYQSERLWIAADDGVEVPVSLVYRRDSFVSSRNPLLVYGYGSYGVSIDAGFDAERLSLLDRGFVFAIAHVRGGGELGQQWYEDGKFLHKTRSFTDYLAVCRALLERGYGDPQRLYGMGGSAGGLLMGAAINMAPDLFHGVVAQVPFVDVLTTMLDESIPLTTGEFEEWGNPQDPVYYEYIKGYSPYDNVSAQNYPHLLVTSGLHDSQVQYWEPAKWVAKLREYKTDNNQLLLMTDMAAGHGGKSGRFKACEDSALEFTFLIALAEGAVN